MLKASADTLQSDDGSESPDLSANLSTALLRYVHRLLLPANLSTAGHWRQTQVFLQGSAGAIDERLEFPSWAQVPSLMEELVTNWNSNYSRIDGGDPEGLHPVDAMTSFFHQLLAIHPFIDGNGRLARAILALQARDLFDLDYDILLDQGVAYYDALRAADTGDLSMLHDLIDAAIDEVMI